MKILIVGVARTGSSALLGGFNFLNFPTLSEPFNILFRDSIITSPLSLYPNNLCLKTLIDQIPVYGQVTVEQFYTSFSEKFDHTIILDRKNYWEHWKSFVNLINKNKIKFKHGLSSWPQHEKWHEDELTESLFNDMVNEGWRENFILQKEAIGKLAYKLDKDITYYEDLFNPDMSICEKTIEKWGININTRELARYLQRIEKYKQTSKKIPL